MGDKLQTFLITVSVIEGRHYIWPNMNSVVIIQVDKQKKYTALKPHTDCPYYDEYFVFEFLSTFEKFLDKNITITVISPANCIRRRKTLGYVTLDVGIVWFQKDHQFYHKWAILSAPMKDPVAGTRGYLKLDISILSKGEIPKIPKVENTDEIEGHFLLPEGSTQERQRAKFIFDIYKGDYIRKAGSSENSKKPEAAPSTYLEIMFAEIKAKTSTKKNSTSPVWNERLMIPELFPPLCQRFKFDLNIDKKISNYRYLNLRSISNDREEGFLPTFGPHFFYFYSQNNLEGFQGQVLFSLHTEVISTMLEMEKKAPKVMIESIAPAKVDFIKYDDFLLFVGIFEASCICKKYSDKPISFKIGCGPTALPGGGDKINSSVTDPMKPLITNKDHCYVDIRGTKPCVYSTMNIPDFRQRIYHRNILGKTLRALKSKLDFIERIFTTKDYKIASIETEDLLTEVIDFLTSASVKYLDLVQGYKFYSELEQERIAMIRKEMEKIKTVAPSLYDIKSKRRKFQKLDKVYRKIEALVDDLEDWPRVYLWMMYGQKKVAYFVIPSRKITYSPIEEEKGLHCGKIDTIFLQTPSQEHEVEFISIACKMEVFFWMGLARHWQDNLQSIIPEGFTTPPEVPKSLAPEEQHFECRAHIFQGRFTPGSDKSGLCDPFVHVIVGGQYRSTTVLEKTLNPLWDQTLVFTWVTLYGTQEFIQNSLPKIVVEIHDKDECGKTELVGRLVVTPNVQFLNQDNNTRLKWYNVNNPFEAFAELLAAIELVELAEAPTSQDDRTIFAIPPEIKPHLVNYRVEVMFWGVRCLKKLHFATINKPKIVFDILGHSVTSDTLVNAKKLLNFSNPLRTFEVVFPEEEEYAPAMSLKMFDCRHFGIQMYAGTHVCSIGDCYYLPITMLERERRILEGEVGSFEGKWNCPSESLLSIIDDEEEEKRRLQKEKEMERKCTKKCWKKCCLSIFCGCCGRCRETDSAVTYENDMWEDIEDFDWWTKFYASISEIYSRELENQPEFHHLTDTLRSFPLYKGKRTGDELVDEANTTAVLKAQVKVYKSPPEPDWITPTGLPLEMGLFQDFPSNHPLRFVLRVYCVRGLGFRPKDRSGKSDPYLYVSLNEQVINDRDRRVMRQTSPIFGRCFEFTGLFPQDHSLRIAVYDWDLSTHDDLIGETKIDIENRFYTRHRAHCGLPNVYFTTGYCQWRDLNKPVWILDALCKRYNLPEPEYEATSVRISSKEFQHKSFIPTGDISYDRQVLALFALHRWRELPTVGCELVPEHVETRSLFNPNKPGIEQGKLQMWIDILPCGDFPTPKQVDITPRIPDGYELRVVIWNVEKIQLDEDDFFTGERKSDIFVKGWLQSPDLAQYTDVHYRSLNGEGNFNWRFIFRFNYLPTENKMIIREKETIFSVDESEAKMPCKIYLQVWDNDTISANDLLGVLHFELSRMPRGARRAQKSSLSQLDPAAPTLNLFKLRRTKGWWPFMNVDEKTNEEMFAGTVEAEFEILTSDEAQKNPAGLGRNEPQALPKPKRPDTSFSWFRSPWKALKYLIKSKKWKIIKCLICLLLIIGLAVAVYSTPGYVIKKILHLS